MFALMLHVLDDLNTSGAAGPDLGAQVSAAQRTLGELVYRAKLPTPAQCWEQWASEHPGRIGPTGFQPTGLQPTGLQLAKKGIDGPEPKGIDGPKPKGIDAPEPKGIDAPKPESMGEPGTKETAPATSGPTAAAGKNLESGEF